MDPLLALGDRRLEVEPGEEVRTTVKVRNSGTIVEQYRLDVLGPAAPWAEVVPAEVSVYPGTDMEVQLILRPPRPPTPRRARWPSPCAAPRWSHPTRSPSRRATSWSGPSSSWRCSWRRRPPGDGGSGRHRVWSHNRGTAPARMRLTGQGPGRATVVRARARVVEAPAGGKGSASLKVRARTPVSCGAPCSSTASSYLRPADGAAHGRARPRPPGRPPWTGRSSRSP